RASESPECCEFDAASGSHRKHDMWLLRRARIEGDRSDCCGGCDNEPRIGDVAKRANGVALAVRARPAGVELRPRLQAEPDADAERDNRGPGGDQGRLCDVMRSAPCELTSLRLFLHGCVGEKPRSQGCELRFCVG